MKKAMIVFAVAVSTAFFVGCQKSEQQLPETGAEAASAMEEEMAEQAEGMEDATSGETIEGK